VQEASQEARYRRREHLVRLARHLVRLARNLMQGSDLVSAATSAGVRVDAARLSSEMPPSCSLKGSQRLCRHRRTPWPPKPLTGTSEPPPAVWASIRGELFFCWSLTVRDRCPAASTPA
jgi:hypothetical protein